MWQIRAAATDRLIELGETVDPYVTPLLEDKDVNLRAAAMRVFIEQDRTSYLGAHI